MAGEPTEEQRRARAIWAYSMQHQDKLAAAAQIDPGRLKGWMGRSRATKPEPDELIRLAEAAGVPRVFAEHGFAGAPEADQRLRQDVDILKEQVSLLWHRLERERIDVAARVLEVTRRLDAIQSPNDLARARRQR